MLQCFTFLLTWGLVLSAPPENPNEFDKSFSPESKEPSSEFCGEPTIIPHSTIDGKAPPYKEGTPLLYICDPGYYLDGSPYSRCLGGIWDGPVMACRPRSCNDPGYPSHGYRHSTDFTYGARVFYYCNEGYQLVGDSHRTCEVDMEWTGTLPSCQVIKTPEENLPVEERGSGEIQVEEPRPFDLDPIGRKNEYDYETIPSKPIDRDILVEGSLTPDLDYPVSPEEPYSTYDNTESESENKLSETKPLEKPKSKSNTHVIRLYPDSRPDRLSTLPPPRFLTEDYRTTPGLISESPDRHDAVVAKTETLDTLVDLDDFEPIKVDPGPEVTDSESGSGSGFSSGEIIDEEIEVGQFTSTSPPKLGAYCGAPPTIENTSNDGTGVSYQDGSYVTYTCSDGYYTEGYSYVACRNGSWEEPRFTCIVKSCEEPPVPENGYKHGMMFTTGSHVFFNCNEGYELVGENYRTCQSNQTWSGSEAFCRLMSCPDPGDLPNGYRQGIVGTYGSTVFYFCNEGYEMVGSSNLTCRSDQTWSAERPTCREMSCQPPAAIANGYFSGSEFNVGGRVFYYCNDGYHLVGENYMYCTEDQGWSTSPPTCIAKSCGDPGVIINGYRQGAEFSVGARVHFYCNPGYELIGKHFRTCLISEDWSDTVPICTEIEEAIIDNNTEETTVGPTVIAGVTDDEDLLTDGSTDLWQNSGMGSGFDFICDESTCKYGGVCFPSAVHFQCVCNFTCETSAAEVTCGSDGHVYGNTCEIRLASCKKQQLITSAPNTMCKELSGVDVLPLCGMESEERDWSDWSLWIKSGSKDIRFRHCRSNRARDDGRSHCAGHDIQTRLCAKERSEVCRSDDGNLGYKYRYKCKGVDGHDLPDSNEVFMGNNSYDDCWFSLFTVKNSKYKYFHWSFSRLMEEGNVQNWCHKRNQFIPFYPSHGYCEMALHYFCHSQSKCWYEDEKEQAKPDDRLDTCWTQFAFGGRPPTVFEDDRSSHSVICQKYSDKSSFGTMFGAGVSHFATLYDTSKRIPVFSLGKLERMSDGGWPVVPFLLERGLVDEGRFISWLFSNPEKGLTSQYELPNKLKEDLCKLGRNQALYDDYKLSGFRVGPLIVPEIIGCHPASKVASFALTNSVPMHLTQYYAWTGAMTGVKEYAIKKCGITVERDHTGVYCQNPETVKSTLYLASGAVASHDPREAIGNDVNIPSLVWMAGCCVDTDGGRVRSFAFYLMNKADFPVRKVPVSELETLLSVMTDPREGGGSPMKIFPASTGICGNPLNDDTARLNV